MPSVRSSRAPHFSGGEDELLTEFLREYEDLADGFGLTEEQKLYTILRYIPRTLKCLWVTRPGYQAGDWDDFRTSLEELYPDVTALSRHTKQGLDTFRELSAKSRIRDEAQVLKYYRNFLTVATPLLANHQITIGDFNAAFFKGFHPSIQGIIAERLEIVYPHHPVHEPFPVQGVLEAARRHFTPNHFYRRDKSQKVKNHDKHRSHAKRHHDTPDAFIQRTFGDSHSLRRRRSRPADPDSDSHSSSDSDSESEESSDTSSPEYETKKVRFKQSRVSRSRSKEDNDPLALVTKLQSLSVHEPSYLILYTQCQKRFPDIAQYLPKPQLHPSASASASVAYQPDPAPTQPLQQHLHRDLDFGPGTFVLVPNSGVENDLQGKAKPRYMGPMVVLRRTQDGSYRLADSELDGAMSNLRSETFRLVPYHAGSRSSIPVMCFVDRDDLGCVNVDEAPHTPVSQSR
jgi:hypothetical protein